MVQCLSLMATNIKDLYNLNNQHDKDLYNLYKLQKGKYNNFCLNVAIMIIESSTNNLE